MIVHADTNDIAKEKNLLDNIKKIVKQGGLRPLQPPVPLPATRRAQRVNDEPVKVLNLLFFVYFIWKWGETFEKLHFFSFGPKQSFYPFSTRILWKTDIKQKTKNVTFNGCISKARANSESKLTFSESSFNFLQKGLFSARST